MGMPPEHNELGLLLAIHTTLGNLDGKLDAHLKQYGLDKEDEVRYRTDVEQRLEKIEGRWNGIVAALGVAVAGVMAKMSGVVG